MENTGFTPMSRLAIWCSSPELFSVSEPGPPAKAVTPKPDGEARMAVILNNARGPTGGSPGFSQLSPCSRVTSRQANSELSP